MNRWEMAILKSTKSLGGEAQLQQIYKRLLDFKLFLKMTKEHLRITYGRPTYSHQVRSHISNLCQKGELRRIGIKGEGRYHLTKKGIKRIDIENGKKTFMGGSKG